MIVALIVYTIVATTGDIMDLYTIPIPNADRENAYIIYRPLLGLAFTGNQSMANLAESLSDDPTQPPDEEVQTFLKNIGFLRPDPPSPQPPLAGKFSPTGLTLLMTNQCQLRCTYCYAAAGDSPRQHLSLETGIAAIDYTYENLKKLNYPIFHISLHGGGEPTFPWKTLRELVAYAREKAIPTEFSLTSNGVWSRQQTQWILSYIDFVGISMDGSPQTQDSQRPLASGKASSRWVLRTIQELEANQRPYRLRMTAMAPFDHLTEDIRFLCENTQCPKIQVEAAYGSQRGGAERIPDQPADDDGRELKTYCPPEGRFENVCNRSGILTEGYTKIAMQYIIHVDEKLFKHGLVGSEKIYIMLIDLFHACRA